MEIDNRLQEGLNCIGAFKEMVLNAKDDGASYGEVAQAVAEELRKGHDFATLITSYGRIKGAQVLGNG